MRTRIQFMANSVEIDPDGYEIKVTLSHDSLKKMFEESVSDIDISQLIEILDKDDVLESIGESYIKEYFGI